MQAIRLTVPRFNLDEIERFFYSTDEDVYKRQVQQLVQKGQPAFRVGCLGVVLHRQAVLTEQAALLKRAVRQMVHAVVEVDAVLFDGERVGKGQQLDGLQNVGDLF